ncbi:ferredoxin-type protein NapF [Brenneria roseae subsp. americana]|uniref:Ferredoxin-type protein NapF n=1 Tax=Brenneria roseae subsp. americana TaxID=1508507 RepID=A0A2U1TYI9_9GAMM|nr:4Fe-4S dicluster domain-containing protein [Brenneria roseae]PWC14422.1 ferredoxin-type protein NapF [Brenneria roseae subsp. americana]
MDKTDNFYREYLSHRYISRRGLFRALLTASQKTVPPDTSPEAARLARTPRPPGAIAPELFLHQCTRCQQCIEHCPMGVITRDDDGYPLLVIEYASCDGCNQCIQHCASGALQPQAQFDTGLRPIIDTRRCIHTQRHCGQCLASCTEQALDTNEYGYPVVDTSRCSGCGECLIQCDERAITLTVQPS